MSKKYASNDKDKQLVESFRKFMESEDLFEGQTPQELYSALNARVEYYKGHSQDSIDSGSQNELNIARKKMAALEEKYPNIDFKNTDSRRSDIRSAKLEREKQKRNDALNAEAEKLKADYERRQADQRAREDAIKSAGAAWYNKFQSGINPDTDEEPPLDPPSEEGEPSPENKEELPWYLRPLEEGEAPTRAEDDLVIYEFKIDETPYKVTLNQKSHGSPWDLSFDIKDAEKKYETTNLGHGRRIGPEIVKIIKDFIIRRPETKDTGFQFTGAEEEPGAGAHTATARSRIFKRFLEKDPSIGELFTIGDMSWAGSPNTIRMKYKNQ